MVVARTHSETKISAGSRIVRHMAPGSFYRKDVIGADVIKFVRANLMRRPFAEWHSEGRDTFGTSVPTTLKLF